jgi:hypothetical protein
MAPGGGAEDPVEDETPTMTSIQPSTWITTLFEKTPEDAKKCFVMQDGRPVRWDKDYETGGKLAHERIYAVMILYPSIDVPCSGPLHIKLVSENHQVLCWAQSRAIAPLETDNPEFMELVQSGSMRLYLERLQALGINMTETAKRQLDAIQDDDCQAAERESSVVGGSFDDSLIVDDDSSDINQPSEEMTLRDGTRKPATSQSTTRAYTIVPPATSSPVGSPSPASGREQRRVATPEQRQDRQTRHDSIATTPRQEWGEDSKPSLTSFRDEVLEVFQSPLSSNNNRRFLPADLSHATASPQSHQLESEVNLRLVGYGMPDASPSTPSGGPSVDDGGPSLAASPKAAADGGHNFDHRKGPLAECTPQKKTYCMRCRGKGSSLQQR